MTFPSPYDVLDDVQSTYLRYIDTAFALPEGALALPNGTIRLPEGATLPAGAAKLPDGTVKLPDTTTVLPPGTVKLPTAEGAPARYFDPDGNIAGVASIKRDMPSQSWFSRSSSTRISSL